MAWGLGGDHPAVRAWLAGNGLPADLIPPGPGVTWILAPTHDASKEYHRHRVEALVGVDEDDRGWSARDARAEASLKVDVPGYRQKAVFRFKAHSQGVNGMKGGAIRYLGVDEECPEAMYNEALKRLGEEEKGRCVFSMTPDVHKGISWVKGRFHDKREPGVHPIEIFNEDNPHVPEGLLDRLTLGMSDTARAAALRGAFGTAHGLIWGDYRRGVHAIPTREVPIDWPRFGGVDFGWNNPNAVLWGALDSDGVLEVYRELYRPRLAASEVGDLIKAEDDDLVAGHTDPSAGGIAGCAELCKKGLPFSPTVPYDVEEGLKNVSVRFAGMTLRIQSCCVNLLREIDGYRRGPKGKPIKVNDHACDALRYLVNCVAANTYNYGSMSGALDSDELRDESYWHNV